MARLLVLTAVFCAVAVQLGVNALPGCGWGLLWCENKKDCFADSLRCDGARDCKDGSDEVACDIAIPSVKVAVNSNVTARVHFVGHWPGYNTIEVLLCGTTSCGRVSLFGTQDNEGTFAIDTETKCNLQGRDCRVSGTHTRGYNYDLRDGEYNIQVERRASEMAVYRVGQPELVWTIPTEEDQDTLRVRPYKMWTDMPVEFTVV